MPEIHETETFSGWFAALKDATARGIVAARVQRLRRNIQGDVRPVGQGISEMRIHYGPGYRVYFVQRSERLIVLLCAGSKATQRRDIARAHSLLHQLEDQR
jgi:putative addiction module killer protein